MSNKYKISVIIPVYNAEKYIEKCLTSLFENTIATECEFIIINDCSSDFSEKEIKKLLREFSYLKNNIIFILIIGIEDPRRLDLQRFYIVKENILFV